MPGVPVAPRPSGGLLADLGSLFVPLVPGALVVVMTFFLFQHAVDRQFEAIDAMCDSEAGRVQLEIERGLDARATAMERLAATRLADGEAWRAEAEELTRGELQFRAVLEFDSTLALRAVMPADARLMSALDPRDDDTRSIALRVATGTLRREAVTVSTAPLAAGERQLLVCAPVVRGGLRLGWIVGLLRVRDLLDEGLTGTLQRGFSAGVFEGPELLHGARVEDGGPGVSYTRQTEVLRGPLLWRVQVWPAEELTRRLESRGPAGVFVAGMLLAFFVSASLYLWREQRLPPDSRGA